MKSSNNVLDSPKLCIGMPVYNDRRFLRNALDSLLTQTFTDFELIISDNASTDSTSEICHEYLKKDERIKYIRQKTNIGVFSNFEFVLQQSKCKYFMWAAADDYWLPTFLEKNIQILESNENIIGSISKILLYDDLSTDFKPNIKKPDAHSKNCQFVYPAIGIYEEKVRLYLRFLQASAIYGIYRTDKLKESFIHDRFWIWDLAVILNVLKYGDLYVIDDVLMYRFVEKRSKSIINTMLKYDVNLLKIIFLGLPFTVWCARNLGWKIFFKNIPIFVKLNLRCEFAIGSELVRICKRLIFGQEKFW